MTSAQSQGSPKASRLAGVFGEGTSGTGERLPSSRVCEWLTAARNYWVATSGPDGRPQVSPVWGLWLDDTFYFATHPRAWKARNLALRPEIAVHLESGQEVAILQGIAVEVTDASLLARLADAWQAKYGWRPETSQPLVHYAVRPHVALSWLEGDPFLETATRWQFDSQ